MNIENVKVDGFEAAIRGMRNPKESWNKSDSYASESGNFILGDNDRKLAQQLIKAGSDHSKFMRYINVSFDLTLPLYVWQEFDTYKVSTVRNSCSKMHKLTDTQITLDKFSVDLFDKDITLTPLYSTLAVNFRKYINFLEQVRELYNKTNDSVLWRFLVQALPEGWNQKATISLNYQVLRNMYHSRKSHKLSEWRDFCDFIRALPYSYLITMSSGIEVENNILKTFISELRKANILEDIDVDIIGKLHRFSDKVINKIKRM